MAPASMTVEYAPGKSLTIETGEIGRLAGGAVLVTAGDTIVYTTACVSPEPTSDGSFAPLQVHFVERMSAGGRTLCAPPSPPPTHSGAATLRRHAGPARTHLCKLGLIPRVK